MQRVFVLLKRKPGMSVEAFRRHYENGHALLGEKHFGHLFESYRRNYIPGGMRLSDGENGECAYGCPTELTFRDPEGYLELKRIARSPEVHAILKADEERFLDRTMSMIAISAPIESDVERFRRD